MRRNIKNPETRKKAINYYKRKLYSGYKTYSEGTGRSFKKGYIRPWYSGYGSGSRA